MISILSRNPPWIGRARNSSRTTSRGYRLCLKDLSQRMASCLFMARFRMKTNTSSLPSRPSTASWTLPPKSLSSGTRIIRAVFPIRTRSSRSSRFVLAPTNPLQRCASSSPAAISLTLVRSDNLVTAIRVRLLPSPTSSTRSSSFGACLTIFLPSRSACVPYTFRRLWSNVSSWAVDVVDFTDPPFRAEKNSPTATYLIYNSPMEFVAELQASLREFTLAAACARIELPRSDLWRWHHSSQELLRHRR